MSESNPSMEDLPGYIMVEILSRLPVKTVIHCKCVCKKWLKLVSDSYFANLHLSRSPAGIMIHQNRVNQRRSYQPGTLKLVEVEDKLDHHHIHDDPVMTLDFNLTPIFQESQIVLVGSVDGLICIWQHGKEKDNTYICNPITREYMTLPTKQCCLKDTTTILHCFGVGSVTKEYKVIWIFYPPSTSTSRPILLEAEVYTLGSGQWTSLGHIPYWLNGYSGSFLNGHAHWTVIHQDSREKLYAFDFEKETFELFPSPPVETIEDSVHHFKTLGVLKGCLCQCDTFDSQLTIWVMKEYGIKESWHKEVVIKQSISPDLHWLMWEPLHLIECLNDGTILMFFLKDRLLAYCPKRREVVGTKEFDCFFKGLAYCPSFLKLQNFKSERVNVF